MSKYQKRAEKKVNTSINKSKNQNQQKVSNQKTNKHLFGFFVVVCLVAGTTFLITYNDGNDRQTDNNPNTPYVPPADDNEDLTDGSNEYPLTQTVTTISNEKIPLTNYAGKSLILYFTGASCIPCKMQLPFLVETYEEYQSTGKIEVISFDIQGKSTSELEQWITDNSIAWKVCQDSGLEMSTFLSIYSMPTLVIFNTDGTETNRYVGAQDEATIQAIFASATDF